MSDAAPAAGRGGPGRPGQLRRSLIPYAYLAPALALYGAFMLVPLGRATQYSLMEWDGIGSPKFVGLDNFVDIVRDERLREAFRHALVLIFFYAILPVALGLVPAALLTRSRVRGLGFFRTVIFLPQVIAMVVVAVTWRQIYAPDGALNNVLRLVGLDRLTRTWLGDYTLTLPAVGLIGTWVSTGLATVLLMAGMSKVPRDLYEAARLDGAGAVREFFAITLPAVRGETVVALTLTIIAALKTFDLVYVTTSGGPGTSTTVPSYEVYRLAFEVGDIGGAAAMGIALTIVVFVITALVNRIGGGRVGEAR